MDKNRLSTYMGQSDEVEELAGNKKEAGRYHSTTRPRRTDVGPRCCLALRHDGWPVTALLTVT